MKRWSFLFLLGCDAFYLAEDDKNTRLDNVNTGPVIDQVEITSDSAMVVGAVLTCTATVSNPSMEEAIGTEDAPYTTTQSYR